MDLLETWHRLDNDRLSKPVKGFMKPPRSSKHTVAKIRRMYYIKSALAVIIMAFFIALFVAFDQMLIRVGLVIVIGGYVLFLKTSITMLSKIKKELPVDKSLIQALQYTRDILQADSRFETMIGLTLYPFSGATGFFMGFAEAGKNVNEIFTNPLLAGILMITIIILTPLCYFLSKWLHKKTYGKCLNDLSVMIHDLESEV
jgi:hypothetical protein